MGPLLFNVAIAALTTRAMIEDPSALYYALFGINCFCAGGSVALWITRRAA